MKVPMFHGDPYAAQSTASFSFHARGLLVSLHCERIPPPGRRIRRAFALRVRNKPMAGHWEINSARTHWTLYIESYSFPQKVASIPAYEVYWAYGHGSKHGCADFETYGGAREINFWRTVAMQQQCERCDNMFDAPLDDGGSLC